MNLHSLVVVSLRLMSINFLIGIAVQLTPALVALSLNAYSNESTPIPWIVLTILLATAALLWTNSELLATAITRQQPSELSLGILTLADCYSIGFLGVGLYQIAGHLGSSLQWFYFILASAISSPGTRWREGVDFSGMITSLAALAGGVALITKGRSWALALASKHARSEERKSSDAPPSEPVH